MSPIRGGPRRERWLFGTAVLLVLAFRASAPVAWSAAALANDLLLLAGSWLLARTWFADAGSAFFVATAAAAADPSVAAVPLLLWLLRGALETGSAPKLFLGLALAGGQAFANPPGTALVAPLAAALFFPAFAVVTGSSPVLPFRALEARRIALPAALGLACALGFCALSLAGARTETGYVDRWLAASLAGNPLRALDFIAGFPPRPGPSLFAGSFTAPLALAALAGLERRTLLRLLGVLPPALLLGGAAFAIAPSPPVLAGAAPLGLLGIFLAGLGLDRILSSGGTAPARAAGASAAAAAVLLAGLSFASDFSLPAADALLRASAVPESDWTAEFLAVSALWSAAAAGTLLLRAAVLRAAPLSLALLLALHSLDVLGWKHRAAWTAPSPASEARAR